MTDNFTDFCEGKKCPECKYRETGYYSACKVVWEEENSTTENTVEETEPKNDFKNFCDSQDGCEGCRYYELPQTECHKAYDDNIFPNQGTESELEKIERTVPKPNKDIEKAMLESDAVKRLIDKASAKDIPPYFEGVKGDEVKSVSNKTTYKFPPLQNPDTMAQVKEDKINHPKHYEIGTIQPFEYIEGKFTPEMIEGYYGGNIIKYISRYKYKNGVEDLKKAKWYLEALIRVMEEVQNEI